MPWTAAEQSVAFPFAKMICKKLLCSKLLCLRGNTEERNQIYGRNY